MKRLVPFLLILLGASTASGSSAGAIASARIVRATATVGLSATANTVLVVSRGAERIHLPVAADRVDLALEIGAASSVTLSDTIGGNLLVSRSPAPAAHVVNITIHNR